MSVSGIEKHNCCGCMACMNICPKGAISSVRDKNGFIYPHVDNEKCVECHLCEKVCGFNDVNRPQNSPVKAYSLVHRNKTVLRNSTSGGAFTALSDRMLENGGIIFGAGINEEFDVRHTEAADTSSRDRLRGTLYVQSDTGRIYSKVKAYLDQGIPVLFVGTPCQVGGLAGYLQKPYEDLIMVELMCHGVPNNDFFKQHICFLEKKYSGKAKRYTFRDKKYAWWTHGIEEITFEDGRRKATETVQAYSEFFRSGISLRPSCLHCTYRKVERVADITIADFWSIKKITGKRNSSGASMLFGNTEKGVAFVGALDRNEAEISEIPLEKAKHCIPTKPAKARKDPEEFWKLYHEKGYSELVSRYTDPSAIKNIRFDLKRLFAKHYGKIR